MIYDHGGDIYTYEDLLDFSVNINPLGMPARVREAACRGVGLSTAYPDCMCRKLRKKLAGKQRIPEEYYIFGNGAAEIFYMLVLAEKPARALLPVPAFSEYEHALNTVDCCIKYYRTQEKNAFCIDRGFLERLDERPDIVFLCSPGNPSGCVTEKNLLLQVIHMCEKLGIRLVVDECFIELLQDPERYSVLSAAEEYRFLTVVRAFTKTYAMPGLRLGYMVTSDSVLREKMEKCRQPWSISIPAQEAGYAALDEEEYIKKSRTLIMEEKRFLEKGMEKLGISYIPSDANYILFRGEPKLAEKFRRKGILIRDCSNYRGLEEGWYRVAVRSHMENAVLLRTAGEIADF